MMKLVSFLRAAIAVLACLAIALAAPTAAIASENPFAGTWTYRTALNIPDLQTPNSQIGRAKVPMTIEETEPGHVTGQFGQQFNLSLEGTYDLGNPPERPATLLFRTFAIVNNEPWEFRYTGYLIPDWSEGIDQQTAMVGTFVRVFQNASPFNPDSVFPAGTVASFIAVKQN